MAGISNCKAGIINASALGNTVVVPAEAGRRIRVWQFFLSCGVGGPVTVSFEDNAGAITGPTFLESYGSFFAQQNGAPWLTVQNGDALNINLSAAVPVGGCVYYTLD